MSIEIIRADALAIPFIMATERLDGYEHAVGRWSEAQHNAALSDGRHAYFIARKDGAAIGFAILRDWAAPERVTLVKRIAVARPGNGIGRALLAQVVNLVFSDTDAWRLWLGVFPDNERARKAYEAVGFRAEGVARGSAYFGGVHRDELMMAILRSDWRAGRADIGALR